MRRSRRWFSFVEVFLFSSSFPKILRHNISITDLKGISGEDFAPSRQCQEASRGHMAWTLLARKLYAFVFHPVTPDLSETMFFSFHSVIINRSLLPLPGNASGRFLSLCPVDCIASRKNATNNSTAEREHSVQSWIFPSTLLRKIPAGSTLNLCGPEQLRTSEGRTTDDRQTRQVEVRVMDRRFGFGSRLDPVSEDRN